MPIRNDAIYPGQSPNNSDNKPENDDQQAQDSNGNWWHSPDPEPIDDQIAKSEKENPEKHAAPPEEENSKPES